MMTSIAPTARVGEPRIVGQERRKSNAVLLGGSSFTARWRTCANFALIASKVKACKHCLEMLLNNIVPVDHHDDEHCTNCTCLENRELW